MIRFTFLAENKTEHAGCRAEHGLSIYVETEEMRLLFDAGLSDLFAENAATLGVPLETVEALVISHGHFDHTNGVPRFAALNETAPIYVHRAAFSTFYGSEGDKIDEDPCGILWTEAQRRALEPRLRYTDGPVWLTDNIVVSGTIPDDPDTAPAERFYRRTDDGVYKPDDMRHEQFLAVRNGEKGIFLFSGCSHKGIIAAIQYARQLFPGEKIGGVIAGMHLNGATDALRRDVVDRIVAAEPDMVMPVHCTGIDAICLLKTAMGDRCIAGMTGQTYVC